MRKVGRTLGLMLLLAFAAPPAHADAWNFTTSGTAYQPQELTVKIGDTIKWVNKDTFAHTFTAEDKDVTIVGLQCGNLPCDEHIAAKHGTTNGILNFTITGGTVGPHVFHCTIHTSANMVGVLIIQPN